MEQNLTQKVQNLRCLIRLGEGGLNPNETLSHSDGKFVFDHGPNCYKSTFIILDFSPALIFPIAQKLKFFLMHHVQLIWVLSTEVVERNATTWHKSLWGWNNRIESSWTCPTLWRTCWEKTARRLKRSCVLKLFSCCLRGRTDLIYS